MHEEDLGPRLAARLTFLLKRALLELEDLHAEHLAGSGVNGRELAVLLLLDGHGPESQQQAAARLGVDRTSMVGLLDGLEGKGLVARRPDAGDRRRNVVELTPAGAEALEQAAAASDEAERALLRDLDASEAAQLRALLRRVGGGRTPRSSPRSSPR